MESSTPQGVTSPKGEDTHTLSVPVSWEGTSDLPIVFGNQFMVQFMGDEVVITVGQLHAPPLTGNPQEMASQLSKLEHIRVRAAAKIAMSKTRLDELILVLTNIKNAMEKQESSDANAGD